MTERRPTAPEFIRTIPAEVEQYGPAAAIVLAHIRFRCQTEGPDRIIHEGSRWWQVTRRVMGEEAGLTPRAVGIALEKLGERVSAKYLADEGGQPWFYRVNEAATSSNTFSVGGATTSNTFSLGGSENVGTPLRKRAHPPTQTQSSPIYKELEEGERSAAPPPSSQSADGKQTFRPRCPKHIHDENPPSCHGCGEAREAAKAAAKAAEQRDAAERARIRAAIDGCRECDQYGRLDDLNDCPKHPNFRDRRVPA